MKRLRISRLMDEYTDTEFFPTGGSAVSPERVKARVLAGAKAQTEKRQLPRKKKVLLAAALAAAMVLLMGAGYPFFQHLLVNGELSFQKTANGGITSFVSYGNIVECKDGRLIFCRNDGQHIDITDLVSEETPYIYDGSDPGTGLTYYIIMGGTPECYGWLAWIRTPNPLYDGGRSEHKVTTAYQYYLMDQAIGGQSDKSGLVSLDNKIVEWDDNMDHPWLLAGAEQIGITFVPTEEFEAIVESGTQ